VITEIPTAEDFQAAGLNQLYLAWQVSMQAVEDYERLVDRAVPDDEAAAGAEYWLKSQPALANAFGLVQQAMEMALKGRIASVSPYLLISRDPKDWPKGVDSHEVPFSEFRTLDAADLVKVHNSFCATPLDTDFRAFWEGVRRDRNKIMHSVSPLSFEPATLLRTILVAAEALFADERWPHRLFAMESEGKYAAYGLDDGTQNVVMGQVDIAIRHLTPAERNRFFGYDSRKRAYLCPRCYDHADHKWQDSFPHLAQLLSRRVGEASLRCSVCDVTSQVERTDCINPACESNVIKDGICLTCIWSQDSPHHFPSGLADPGLESNRHYDFSFERGHESTGDYGRFATDKLAIEHARRAMSASYLSSWEVVAIHCPGSRRRARGLPTVLGGRGRLLGSWVRRAEDLVWLAKQDARYDGLLAR
jgi:hypothetical protein